MDIEERSTSQKASDSVATPLPWFKRDIIRPATEFEHEALRHVQRVLRVPVTGDMDEATIVSLRGVQHVFGLRVTGILDRATAEEIENIRSYYAV